MNSRYLESRPTSLSFDPHLPLIVDSVTLFDLIVPLNVNALVLANENENENEIGSESWKLSKVRNRNSGLLSEIDSRWKVVVVVRKSMIDLY